MGAVYEAEDIVTSQRVALKIVKLMGGSTRIETQIRRFRREVRAAMAIEDPHIVKVLDSGQDPETSAPFIAMEYLVGEDLEQLLSRIGLLSPDAAARIAAQACEGILRAHEAGI